VEHGALAAEEESGVDVGDALGFGFGVAAAAFAECVAWAEVHAAGAGAEFGFF